MLDFAAVFYLATEVLYFRISAHFQKHFIRIRDGQGLFNQAMLNQDAMIRRYSQRWCGMARRSALALFRVFHCTMLTRFSQCGPDLSIWETSPFSLACVRFKSVLAIHGKVHGMQVIDDPKDPVFVSPASALMGGKILLYIGERKRGRTRIAALTTGEARIVAHALMSLAEQKMSIIGK
jgi:hypothetical protein